jgi:hypothetical protein
MTSKIQARLLLSAATIAILLVPGCLEPAGPGPDPEPRYPSLEQALLWNDVADQLSFRLIHAPGYEPADDTVLALIKEAQRATAKTTVNVAETTTIPNHNSDQYREWTTADLRVLANQYQAGNYYADGTAMFTIFFLDGVWLGGPNASGGGVQVFDAAFVFGDIYGGDLRVPLPGAQTNEQHTTLHEFGHAIGLVNCGIPMVVARETGPGECHSTNDSSVMNGVTALEAIVDAFAEGTLMSSRFDQDDLDDIRAFQQGH